MYSFVFSGIVFPSERYNRQNFLVELEDTRVLGTKGSEESVPKNTSYSQANVPVGGWFHNRENHITKSKRFCERLRAGYILLHISFYCRFQDSRIPVISFINFFFKLTETYL